METLLKTAHVSVSILYINTCWVGTTCKQKSGQVRLVTISVTVLDKKLSSIREMSARCHRRGVPGLPLLRISNIPLRIPTGNSCVVCVSVVVKGKV